MTGMKGRLSFFEKIVYIVILVLAIAGFNYADIDITSTHGLAFLDAARSGKICQFYTFAIPYHEVPPFYDIAYYLLFGLWELPLWLAGLILDQPIPAPLRIVWCKILLALLYFIACWLASKLIGHVASGDDAEEYRLWMPLSFFAVFTTFMMGQYDIIYLVIMLYALLLLIEKRSAAAALLFGVSALFKYFPLLVAVPAFLAAEKRKDRLIRDFGLCILPVVLGKIPFLFDSAPAQLEMRNAFFKGMFGRLFAPEIMLGSGKAALFIILYIAVCFWAYAGTGSDEKLQKQKILYFPFLILCSLFLCILWHVGWLLLLVPFVVFAAAWNPRFKVEIYYASLLLFGGVLVYVSGCAHHHEAWFAGSPVVGFLPKMEALSQEAKYTFISFFSHYELVPVLFLSVITGGLVLLAVFAWPGWKKEKPLPEKNIARWELYLPLGIIPFLVLAFIALHLLSVRSEHKLFQPDSAALKYYRPSWKKEEESFTNRLIANTIHLKKKQFSAPACLVPRCPKGLEKISSVGQTRYDLALPPYDGIQATLKSVHLVLEEPLRKSPQIALHTEAGSDRKAECSCRVPGQHFVIQVKPGQTPRKISLFSDGETPVLKEYYLEFEEKTPF